MAEDEAEGLGRGIQFPDQYRLALASHKATDMKHDKLTLGESGSFWGHYYKFIPSSIVDVIKAKEKPGKKDDFFTTLSDNNFMETYIHGDDPRLGPTRRPIKSMLDLILYCTGETDISRLNNRFGERDNGLANGGEPKPVYVKFGDDLVYSYTARLQNLNFSIRKDDSGNRSRTVEPTVMLENLGIFTGSIFNVDFQYHLWDLLKSGRNAPEYKIYLIMNPENINDPAGKFNMNDPIFKRPTGVSTLLATCKTSESTSYSSFDSRIPNESGPDFFSRFDVVISGIKPISNLCGLIKSFGVELTIQSKPDNFIYSEMSKANNSNAAVRGELSKIFGKYNAVPKTSSKKRDDLELLMAAEAAKKGGGDDLQLLSHWHICNRDYEIVNPVSKTKETKTAFDGTNRIFFVSHDGPTIVRALIEGDNVLFMYSQVIGGKKYECAISLIRGEVTRPPEYERIQQKYTYIKHKFKTGPEMRIYEKIKQMNSYRDIALIAKKATFDEACVSGVPTNKSGPTDYITELLNTAVSLCIARNCLCAIESVTQGISLDALDYFTANRKILNEIILGLTAESDETVLKNISLILKTLEEKNKLISEEEYKYDGNGEISSIFQKRLDSSPEFIATKEWNRVQRTSRGSNTGVVSNKVLYEQYFEMFSKWFTEEESRAFIDSLNKAAAKFDPADAVLQNVKELLAYAITRLDTYKSIDSNGEKIEMTIDDIKNKRINIIAGIATSQRSFLSRNNLEDVSNFDETKDETKRTREGLSLGGARRRDLTPLFSTNDRGLPYSPCVSYLSNNLFSALKSDSVFTESDAYGENEYNEYDEDQRSAPDERHLLGRVSIQNIPTSESERTYRQAVLPTEGGKFKRTGGQSSSDFEEILIIGKLMGLFPKDLKTKYINEFKSATKLSTDESLRTWINFRFPNPISSFYLIFYTLELFFEDTERKIKTSAYLSQFVAYFFSMKRYADELILLCETITHANLVDRFKEIRRIGSIFNLLFHSFPYIDDGEDSINELLNTESSNVDKTYDFSRITMNLVYQYAGTVEYDKEDVEMIRKNKDALLKTEKEVPSRWNSFTKRTGTTVTSDMFNLFQGYDNSTILIAIGSIKSLLPINSHEDVRANLNRLHSNRIVSSNLTMDALWNPEKKAEAKRKSYNDHQDRIFHNFLIKLKEYNEHIFQWMKKDVLNNIAHIKSVDLQMSKKIGREQARNTQKRHSSIAEPILGPSISRAIAVNAGGKKTRRNRK